MAYKSKNDPFSLLFVHFKTIQILTSNAFGIYEREKNESANNIKAAANVSLVANWPSAWLFQ